MANKSIVLSDNLRKSLAKGRDMSDPIQKALLKISLLIQNSAKEFAPYKTWSLRKSITHVIQKNKAIIWSPLKYARRRNYENNLNPDRKFYLVARAYDTNKDEIQQIFKDTLKVTFW